MKRHIPGIEERQQQLRQYLLQLAPDKNKEEIDQLVARFEMATYAKNQLILKAGEFSDDFSFICKGLVRIYYVKEGKEITNWFMKEDMILVPGYTVMTGHTNIMNFIALEDTYVLKIKYSELESFYFRYHSLANMGRKQVEKYFGAFMNRTFNTLYISAEERYAYFIKEHGDLLNRVPLRYIAAYLGITQETLSRLRGKSILCS